MPLKNNFESLQQRFAEHGYIATKTEEKEGRKLITLYEIKKDGKVVYSTLEFFDFYRWFVRHLATVAEKADHQNCLMR